MKRDGGMLHEPPDMLRPMGIEIFNSDMKLPVRILSHDLVREVQKIPAPSTVMTDSNHACSHFEGSEQGGRVMWLVLMTEPTQSMSAGEAKRSPSQVNGLNGRLLHLSR